MHRQHYACIFAFLVFVHNCEICIVLTLNLLPPPPANLLIVLLRRGRNLIFAIPNTVPAHTIKPDSTTPVLQPRKEVRGKFWIPRINSFLSHKPQTYPYWFAKGRSLTVCERVSNLGGRVRWAGEHGWRGEEH